MFGRKKTKDHDKVDRGTVSLNPKLIERLEAFAVIRGQDARQSLAQLSQNIVRSRPTQLTSGELSQLTMDMVKLLPTSPPPKALACADLEIEEATLVDDTPFIKLQMGRVFYGLPCEPHHRALYTFLADLLPNQITPETYHLANEIQGRYFSVNYRGMPGSGGVIVEAGAYIGFKAIAFADIVGPTGKVIAIEMIPENAKLMERNVRANGLENVITTVSSGLWNEPGEFTATFKNYQQNSLVELDDRKYKNQMTVKTDTLDNIFDRTNVKTIDFLNMQINGAELEALQGLKRRINDVKLLRIASYYKRQGQPTVDVCRKILEELGCVVLNQSPAGSIYASPKHFAHEFADIKPQQRLAAVTEVTDKSTEVYSQAITEGAAGIGTKTSNSPGASGNRRL